MIRLTHNFDGKKFMWLYAKYANGCNPARHCTNAIRGKYSKRFSRLNKDFLPGQTISMDEFPSDSWDAIYICGVSRNGYTRHENYPHNVHVAVLPRDGTSDHWEFENWKLDVQGGVFEIIPSESEIDSKYLELPKDYWTCRMFRWAVWHYLDKGRASKIRNRMLNKLKAIKEPLVSMTGFCDGVTCEYLSQKGCGGFELLDMADIDEYDYDSPDQVWDEMRDNDLQEWLCRLESGDFKPISSQCSGPTASEHCD